MSDEIEVEIVDRPRRDILVLKILFDNGPTSATEIHRILQEKYNDRCHVVNVRQVLASLLKNGMVKPAGKAGKYVLYKITDKGMKLLKHEGLIP